MTVSETDTTLDILRNTEVVQRVPVMFDVASTTHPDRSDLLRLAAGTLGAVQIPGMLPVQACQDLVARLDQYEFDLYDPRRIYPPVAKFGPAVYDYYLDGALRPDYWEHSEAATAKWAQVMGTESPLRQIVASLESAWDGPVRRATVDGKPLFAGMIREFAGGARLHFDEVVREFPGVFDRIPLAQFGFNCYISVPESGGELTVFRQRWKPTDDERRSGYGWHSGITDGQPSLTLAPATGDGILMDSRNYHSVAPAVNGRRVTLSFFVGVTEDNSLIIWS